MFIDILIRILLVVVLFGGMDLFNINEQLSNNVGIQPQIKQLSSMENTNFINQRRKRKQRASLDSFDKEKNFLYLRLFNHGPSLRNNIGDSLVFRGFSFSDDNQQLRPDDNENNVQSNKNNNQNHLSTVKHSLKSIFSPFKKNKTKDKSSNITSHHSKRDKYSSVRRIRSNSSFAYNTTALNVTTVSELSSIITNTNNAETISTSFSTELDNKNKAKTEISTISPMNVTTASPSLAPISLNRRNILSEYSILDDGNNINETTAKNETEFSKNDTENSNALYALLLSLNKRAIAAIEEVLNSKRENDAKLEIQINPANEKNSLEGSLKINSKNLNFESTKESNIAERLSQSKSSTKKPPIAFTVIGIEILPNTSDLTHNVDFLDDRAKKLNIAMWANAKNFHLTNSLKNDEAKLNAINEMKNTDLTTKSDSTDVVTTISNALILENTTGAWNLLINVNKPQTISKRNSTDSTGALLRNLTSSELIAQLKLLNDTEAKLKEIISLPAMKRLLENEKDSLLKKSQETSLKKSKRHTQQISKAKNDAIPSNGIMCEKFNNYINVKQDLSNYILAYPISSAIVGRPIRSNSNSELRKTFNLTSPGFVLTVRSSDLQESCLINKSSLVKDQINFLQNYNYASDIPLFYTVKTCSSGMCNLVPVHKKATGQTNDFKKEKITLDGGQIVGFVRIPKYLRQKRKNSLH